MSRFLSNSLAVFRGYIFAILSRLFMKSRINASIKIVKYKNVCIRVNKASKMTIGKDVRLGENTLISTLNGGQLMIGDGVSIGRGNSIVCHKNIKIGKDTILAPNVLVYDHNHIFNGKDGVEKKKFTTKPINIGDNCWIGANVVILKGTQIGNRCVVAAGCVLNGIYPDDSLIMQDRQIKVSKITRRSE